MAFRASSVILSDALADIKRRALSVKSRARATRDRSAAGPIEFNELQALHADLRVQRLAMASLAALPGLSAYAQQQENDGAYQVSTEYAAMQAAIQAAEDWLVANIPATVAVTRAATGISLVTYSTAQTAGLRTVLDALDATIG